MAVSRKDHEGKGTCGRKSTDGDWCLDHGHDARSGRLRIGGVGPLIDNGTADDSEINKRRTPRGVISGREGGKIAKKTPRPNE